MWLLAALFYALDYFQHTAPSVLLKPISENLHLNLVHVGNVMSVYFPIYAISQLPAGYLLDKFGVRRVLSIACIIVSLGLILTAKSTGYDLLLAGRVLIAIGSAFAFIGTLKVAAMWLTPKLFPIAVGLTNTIGVLGGMFGQGLFSKMIENYDWRTSLWYISYFGIGLAVVLLLFLRTKNKNITLEPSQKLKFTDLKILKMPQLWFVAIYAGIMVGTVVNAFSELYDVLFLQYNYNISSEQAAMISTMIFIGIACGGPSHGFISNFLKNRKIWLVICNIITICIFALIVIGAKFFPVWSLYFIYFFLGFFVSSMLVAFAIAKEIIPTKLHGVSMAFVNMIIGLCGAVFQPLVGEVFYWVNGNMKEVVNPNAFIIGFAVLVIPLLIGLICCLKIKVKQ
ncbi:MAG: MFS transporter [bacterium]|nr:MFS transporter [bacterium]